MSLEEELLLKENVAFKDHADITKTLSADLYFLADKKNYIVLQGMSYCADIRLESSDGTQQYLKDV